MDSDTSEEDHRAACGRRWPWELVLLGCAALLGVASTWRSTQEVDRFSGLRRETVAVLGVTISVRWDQEPAQIAYDRRWNPTGQRQWLFASRMDWTGRACGGPGSEVSYLHRLLRQHLETCVAPAQHLADYVRIISTEGRPTTAQQHAIWDACQH